MPKPRDQDAEQGAEPVKKKKHPLGKVVDEFKPKSMRLELGVAAGMLLLLGLVGLIAGAFVPEEARIWVLSGGAIVLLGGVVVGFFCLRGPSTDHVQIRKLGVEFRMSGEVLRVAWADIEYVDSDTQYERDVRRSKNKSTYRAYIGVRGRKSIDLTAEFLRQFEDPALIIKSIRKNTGGTLKYIEMPKGDD